MIKVVDNFLPKEEFYALRGVVCGDNFPWYFSASSVVTGDNCPQFSHMCYEEFQPVSNAWNDIQPVIRRLSPMGILRAKFNATPRTSKVIEKPLHHDFTYGDKDEPLDTKICIYYLNDNDGYTYFETGHSIESVANRAVLFSGTQKHSGTSCTNDELRVVLNINYS